MAEKYKARDNQLGDEVSEVPEKTEKEKEQESSAKVAKTATKAVATYFGKGFGGQVVDAIGNTKAGQQIFDRAGKVISKTPLGKMSKQLDDSGVVDAADKAVDMIGSAGTGGASGAAKGATGNALKSGANGASNIASNASRNATNNMSDNSMTSNTNGDALSDTTKKSNSLFDSGFQLDLVGMIGKKKIIIGIGLIFFFLILFTAIVAGKDFGNLDLTNNTSTIVGTGASKVCTATDIENQLVYLGDSRMVGMESSLNNENVNYIAETSMGYSWLVDSASSQLDSILQDKTDAIIVLSLGVNDLYNIDNYITYYKELIAKYPNNTFYVLSVNPVEEGLASSNGYSVTNSDIESFNNKLKSNFPDNYLDSYSNLTNVSTSDGLHYTSDTDKMIHDYITSSIVSSGKVQCYTGGGNLAVKLEEVATWYIQNVPTYQNGYTGTRKYYQTPFGTRPFGDDCTEFVSAYMSYVSGVDIPEGYSGSMVYPDGVWAQEVANYGWKVYTSDEIGTLQTGDILIAHSGYLYSTKGHHGEVYINETQTFGWGDIKSSYPSSNTITMSSFGGHVHFMDSTHDYVTIYRYEG